MKKSLAFCGATSAIVGIFFQQTPSPKRPGSCDDEGPGAALEQWHLFGR